MILITEFMDATAVEQLAKVYATEYAPALADQQDHIPAKLPGVKALIVRNRTQVTSTLLQAAPDLKCVGRLGVGLDNIDLDACAARAVTVYPATGANNLSVAEYVISSALVLLRNAYQANSAMLAGEWPRQACAGRELAGKTLGLVGFGAIARETANRASLLGMRVCACDPFLPDDDPAWSAAENMALDGVLSEADVVSLHVPLTNQTRHMINAENLKWMKHNAVLINAARGGIVDETALAQALRDDCLGGAALDVFETEPLTAEAAMKFQGLKNLILTPHIAGVTVESNIRVSDMIAKCIIEHLQQR